MFYVGKQEQFDVSFRERVRKKEKSTRFSWELNLGPSDYQLDTLPTEPLDPRQRSRRKASADSAVFLSLSQPNKLLNYFLLLLHVQPHSIYQVWLLSNR